MMRSIGPQGPEAASWHERFCRVAVVDNANCPCFDAAKQVPEPGVPKDMCFDQSSDRHIAPVPFHPISHLVTERGGNQAQVPVIHANPSLLPSRIRTNRDGDREVV